MKVYVTRQINEHGELVREKMNGRIFSSFEKAISALTEGEENYSVSKIQNRFRRVRKDKVSEQRTIISVEITIFPPKKLIKPQKVVIHEQEVE